jgi:hypothetical protein
MSTTPLDTPPIFLSFSRFYLMKTSNILFFFYSFLWHLLITLSPLVRDIYESKSADEGKFFHTSLFRLKTNIM